MPVDSDFYFIYLTKRFSVINIKQPSSLRGRISIYVFAEECNHIRVWTTWKRIFLWVTDHSAAVLLHINSFYEIPSVGLKQQDFDEDYEYTESP